MTDLTVAISGESSLKKEFSQGNPQGSVEKPSYCTMLLSMSCKEFSFSFKLLLLRSGWMANRDKMVKNCEAASQNPGPHPYTWSNISIAKEHDYGTGSLSCQAIKYKKTWSHRTQLNKDHFFKAELKQTDIKICLLKKKNKTERMITY